MKKAGLGLLICFSILLGCYSSALSANINDSETWYNAYVKQKKLGYEWKIIKSAKYHDNDAYLYDEGFAISFCMYPIKLNHDCKCNTYLDENYLPLKQTGSLDMVAINGDELESRKTTFDYTYKDNKIICRYNQSNVDNEIVVNIPNIDDLRRYWQIAMGEDGFEQDKVYKVCYLNQQTMKLEYEYRKIIKIKEPKSGKPRTYDTVETDSKGRELKPVISKSDRLIDYIYDNLKYTETKREDAVSGLNSNGVYLNLSGIATNKKLPENAKICHLTVKLINDSGKKVKWQSDTRQSIKQSNNAKTTEIDIYANPYNEKKSIQIPVIDNKYRKYLSESNGIEVNNPEISALARKIVGSETYAYKAACLIRKWISDNINPYVNVEKKSALKTLHDKRGLCSDNVVLFTALARSVGIPTKLITGLVYSDGCFDNHAWSEIYVGEWIPIDPSYYDDFVDATHIKFEESSDSAILDKPGIDEDNITAEISSFGIFPNENVSENASAAVTPDKPVVPNPSNVAGKCMPSTPQPGPDYTWVILQCSGNNKYLCFWHKNGAPMEAQCP